MSPRIKPANATAGGGLQPPPGAKFATRAETAATTTQSAYLVTRTTPDKLVRHDISDEELTMLKSGSRTFEKDILWAAIGTFLGALAPSVVAVRGLATGAPSFGVWDLVECLICGIGLVVAVIMAILIKNKPEGSAGDLAAAIRERTAKEVGNGI